MRRKRFAPTSLFFVAADAYNQSFCEFFSVANVNRFFITEPNEDSIIYCLEQLCLTCQLASVSSSAGVSLNSSNKDCGEKMIRSTADLLFGVLNDKFVADLIGLVAAYLPQSHSLQCARTWLMICSCCVFGRCNFRKLISLGSVATLLGCGGICNDFIAIFFS